MFINTLILSVSSSIDAMGIGITYGLKKTTFSLFSRITFFLSALIATSISIFLGNIIKNILPPKLTVSLGALVIICIGIYTITQSINGKKDFDFDKSNNIDLKESLFLSLSVTLDSICLGLGSSMLGINPHLFPILVASFHLSFLLLGDILGRKLINISKISNNIWGILSGILLIIIGIFKVI